MSNTLIITGTLRTKITHYIFCCNIQVEKDGNVCREKVINLRDRLSEATQQMNAMAGEYAAVKVSKFNVYIFRLVSK